MSWILTERRGEVPLHQHPPQLSFHRTEDYGVPQLPVRVWEHAKHSPAMLVGTPVCG